MPAHKLTCTSSYSSSPVEARDAASSSIVGAGWGELNICSSIVAGTGGSTVTS